MRVIKHIFQFIFLLVSFHIKAQDYSLKHFQVEDGLSNNGVTCILQDKMGFMWFGTKDGLNRFDGYSFKVFRKTEGNPRSIGSNFIHCLYEDKNGSLLIGTEQGLYEYSDKEEGFRLLPVTDKMYIDVIEEDSLGNLWIISYYQLYRYDRQSKKLEHYSPQDFFEAACLTTANDGNILAGTINGMLEKYNPSTNSFSAIDLFEHSRPNANRWIQSLYRTSTGQIIAGTAETEIKIIELSNSTYTDFTITNIGQASLYIRSVLQTKQNEFWLGTETGLFVYNLRSGTSFHLQKNYNDPFAITDNSVYSICKDRQSGIWIGTYFGGINYLPNQNTPFTKFFPKEGENSISGNVVGQIRADKYGNIWIGTQDAGLNKLYPTTGHFTNFLPDKKPGSISYFVIHGLMIKDDELWMGTFEHGIDVINVRSGKVVRHYEAGVSGFTHNFIYCIYQSNLGEILIGSPHGIFSYDQKNDRFNQFEAFPSRVWFTTILKDEKDNLWGGTFGNGVYSHSSSSGKTTNYLHIQSDSNSLSSNRVSSIFEDSRHNLWFATEEGLCKFDNNSKNFKRFGTKDGFPSDFILSILEDEEDNLWIGTTKGLVRFNPESGNVKIYNVSNGLISDQFSYSSAYKTIDGRMYFGCDKGLISFNPKDFSQNQYISPIYKTGFQVNNLDIEVGDKNSPLKKSIIYTDDVTLTYKQSTFSIDFAALNFSSPKAMVYQYNMEGLSDKWITQNNRRVDFIELAPGTYTFKVKAMNGDGVWSKESKLKIQILPPWWSSTLARFGYALVLLLIGIAIVYYYHNRMKEKARRTFEKLEITKEKELMESKIEFFTNVAHEIKTPLTLIKVPLSKIIKKLDGNSEVEKSLTIMNRNTIRLIELTNQLLDFRKTEISRYKLLLEQTNISELVTEVSASFETLAEEKGISLSLQMPDDPLYSYVDIDAFSKIIYNLFSNAVKYAESDVSISLIPGFRSKNSYTIQVKNDGYLIPEDQREKIFEPFYRIHETEAQTGTGIGLALALSLTQLHNGTLTLDPPTEKMNVFSLTLPSNDCFKVVNGNIHDFSREAKENFES